MTETFPPMLVDNNFVSLLTPKPEDAPAVGFRQGIIQAWNPDTGENTILVGDSMLYDVSILSSGEAIALKVGHVVGLLTAGPSWFILGRITPPNDPNFAASSTGFYNATAEAPKPFAVSASAPFVPLIQIDIPVPLWATQTLVLASAVMSLVNTTSANATVRADLKIAPPSFAGMSPSMGLEGTGPGMNGLRGAFTAVHSAVVDTSITKTVPVTLDLQALGGINWGGTALDDERASLTVSAIFRSTI